MRTRTHEIKLRLNDEEYDRLNKMVERSIFSREAFLRHMLDGYEIQEAPKEFLQFRHEIIRKLDEIRMLVRDRPITDKLYLEVQALSKEVGDLLYKIDEAQIPYYEKRGIANDTNA